MAGVEQSLRRVVAGDFEVIEDDVRGDGFGDDVVRAFSAGIGADVIADQDDHSAALGWQFKQTLGGEEDSVIDVGGATGVKRIDLLGDFAFVLRERNAQLSLAWKR